MNFLQQPVQGCRRRNALLASLVFAKAVTIGFIAHASRRRSTPDAKSVRDLRLIPEQSQRSEVSGSQYVNSRQLRL
jgi:hypothetical protein